MLQSMGSRRVGHNLSNEQQQTRVPININKSSQHTHTHTYTHAHTRTHAHSHTHTCAHAHTSPMITSGIIDTFARIDEPMRACVLVTQSCLTLCDLMECSPLGSSVHGILQARILEWAAISFFRANQIRSDQLLSRVQLFSTA